MQRDWEDEEYASERVRYTRAPRDHLVADRADSYSRRRSRSTDRRAPAGAPNFNVQIRQDRIIDEYRSPSRGRHSTEHVTEGLDDIRHELHELRRDREDDVHHRRHGRGSTSPIGREDMQLALLRERERFDIEREREKLERDIDRLRMGGRDSGTELTKARSEIRHLEDKLAEDDKERRRREERERVLAERDREEKEEKEKRRLYKLEIERKERQEKEERNSMLTELQLDEEKKKRAEREKEASAVAAYEKKKADEKRKKEEMMSELRREEEEKKRKEKDEEEKWRLKLERKRLEEEEKEKAKKREIDEEIRRRLHRVGYQDNQIDVIIDEKKQVVQPKAIAYETREHHHRHKSHSNALVAVSSRSETFVKIHKNHLDIETLRYFKLPYTIDEVCPFALDEDVFNQEQVDTDYFIIYQELDQQATDLLFEHTRKLRKRHKELLIEDRGRKHEPQLAFVRRRTPSASPNRKRDKSADKRVSSKSWVWVGG
jgi:hypothetical protein